MAGGGQGGWKHGEYRKTHTHTCTHTHTERERECVCVCVCVCVCEKESEREGDEEIDRYMLELPVAEKKIMRVKETSNVFGSAI